MPTTKPWSDGEARAVLNEWKVSGLSLYAFCRQRGFVEKRLRYWRAKLGFEPSTPLTLLPVHVVEAPRVQPVRIQFPSGHVVSVVAGFDEVAFARVIALLGEP